MNRDYERAWLPGLARAGRPGARADHHHRADRARALRVEIRPGQ